MEFTAFTSWASHHATRFGFAAEHATMILSWHGFLSGMGYTVAELMAATDILAQPGRVPSGPWAHLEAVQVAALEARHAADRDRRLRALPAPGEVPDRGECVLCQDTGLVEVPHPKCLDGWPFPIAYTAGVICSCWAGHRRLQAEETDDARRKRREASGIGKPMTLAAYEALNPTWRTQFRSYRDACTEHARACRALRADTDLDRALDAAIENAHAAVHGRPRPHPGRRAKGG